MVNDAASALVRGQRIELSYNIANTERAIGTRLSSHITQRFGMAGLIDETIRIRLRGSAGQSLGAFAVQGLKIEVAGDANDYVGKGLCGGIISIRPLASSSIVPEDNTIIGNTVLYGATSGKLFASGQAGERLAVRNSGAIAVVEGCGSNGCEYMTGGEVVVLGAVGANFGAGMTGGMAFVYDPEGQLPSKVNPQTIGLYRLAAVEEGRHGASRATAASGASGGGGVNAATDGTDSAAGYWLDRLKALIAAHRQHTASPIADRILVDWPRAARHFWHIVPHEIVAGLPHAVAGAADAGVRGGCDGASLL